MRGHPRPLPAIALSMSQMMYHADFLTRLEVLLKAELSCWGLSARTDLRLLTYSENASFRASDPVSGQDLVLRVYRPGYHSREEIDSELAWLLAIGKAGVIETLVPRALEEGGYIADILDAGTLRHVAGFVFVEGREPSEEDDLVRWYREIGAINARLHAHTKAWSLPAGFTRKRWDFDAMLGERALWGDWRAALGLDPEGRALLEQTAHRLHARLDAYGTGPERFGLIHGDTRLANLLVDGDRLTVIDFDDCGFSWYLYDFASSISFIEHKPYIPDLQRAWIEGYRSVAPLADEECAILPDLVMLRRMLLTAWLASHSETPTSQELGETYTQGTVALARNYMRA